MTIEEKKNALHCLKVMIDEEVCEECDLYGTTGTDHCEADCVRVAIEALEQEPCEDAISREDAMSMILGYGNEIKAEVMDDIKASMIKLPPIQPKSKTGHWIECMPGGAEEWCYKCSECNFWKYKESINLSKFKFCPNCGSRNEVEE